MEEKKVDKNKVQFTFDYINDLLLENNFLLRTCLVR